MYFDVSMYLFQTLSRVRIELCYSQDGWIFAKLFLHVEMESKSLSLSKRTRPIYSHLDINLQCPKLCSENICLESYFHLQSGFKTFLKR